MRDHKPKVCIHLEIPADCAGMEASVNVEKQILFEFGAFPHENLVVFRDRRALQQFVDLATKFLTGPPSADEQSGATTELTNTLN